MTWYFRFKAEFWFRLFFVLNTMKTFSISGCHMKSSNLQWNVIALGGAVLSYFCSQLLLVWLIITALVVTSVIVFCRWQPARAAEQCDRGRDATVAYRCQRTLQTAGSSLLPQGGSLWHWLKHILFTQCMLKDTAKRIRNGNDVTLPSPT